MRLRTTTAALFAATSLVAAASATAGAQVDRRTLSGREVRVINLVGTVTVESGSSSDVTVEVTRRGADASRLSIEVGSSGGVPTLRVVFPDDDIIYPEMSRRSSSTFTIDSDGNWGGGSRSLLGGRRRIRVRGDGRGAEAWADVRVIVPAGRKVDVKVGVGSVRAGGMNGDLGIDVASANVSVDGHTGTLRLDTGSGGAEVRNMKGDVLSVDVGSGSVSVIGATVNRMALESGSGGVNVDQVTAAEMTVEVGSGGVRIERSTSERVSVETGSGGVRLELSNSPKSLSVESGSGTVTLVLPANLDAELDISTGSGSIDSDFAVQLNRFERRRIRGTVGNGTGRITVETGSGSVRIRKG
ncbi:MAG: DUF4097 family beta strand repeat-containing protein [Gemmatimonadetes bacterium]|nr:DUF4097 family beta strand repeat-containing protein [Gemmatimonadota bacterium]